MGTLAVLFQVSYSSVFVALLPRERFVEGASLMHGSRAFSYVAGPSAAARSFRRFSAPSTLVVDAVSYVVSALFLRSVDVEEPPTEAPGKGHVAAGVRWVFGDPIVRAALGATATINFFNFMFFGALHPLRDEGARRRAGDARARARRRRGGRHRSARS